MSSHHRNAARRKGNQKSNAQSRRGMKKVDRDARDGKRAAFLLALSESGQLPPTYQHVIDEIIGVRSVAAQAAQATTNPLAATVGTNPPSRPADRPAGQELATPANENESIPTGDVVYVTNGGRSMNMKPGVWRQVMSEEEKERFINEMMAGSGKWMLIRDMKLTLKQFAKTLREDSGFAEAIKIIEESRTDEAHTIIYGHMIHDPRDGIIAGDPAIAKSYIQLKQQGKIAQATLRLQQQDLKLKTRMVEQAERTGGGQFVKQKPFASLTTAEFDDYDALCDKVSAGIELDADEAVRFVRYQQRTVAAPVSVDGKPPRPVGPD